MDEDKIKGAASFNMGVQFTIEDIHCDDKENLIDYMWLFNNIPWTNHSGSIGKVTLLEPTEAHIIEMDGYDTSTTEINKIVFDNVIITACHGFAGNSFGFDFRLGEDKVGFTYEYNRFAFTREDAKNILIKTLEQKIKGLNRQIETTNSAIDTIKTL
jgi:hypothetical protein